MDENTLNALINNTLLASSETLRRLAYAPALLNGAGALAVLYNITNANSSYATFLSLILYSIGIMIYPVSYLWLKDIYKFQGKAFWRELGAIKALEESKKMGAHYGWKDHMSDEETKAKQNRGRAHEVEKQLKCMVLGSIVIFLFASLCAAYSFSFA